MTKPKTDTRLELTQEELRAQLVEHDNDIVKIQADARSALATVRRKKAVAAAQLLALRLAERHAERIADIKAGQYPKEEGAEAFEADPQVSRWTREIAAQQSALVVYQAAISGGATHSEAATQTVQASRDLSVEFHARVMQLDGAEGSA